MKFGRNLPRNQVPEWDEAYIKYKALKKLIKSTLPTTGPTYALSAQIQTDHTQDLTHPDTAAFFHALDQNLEQVSGFYNRKFADSQRRLRLLQARYGIERSAEANLTPVEAGDLMSTLVDLRTVLRNLQWYGEVNRRGFSKITKKMDKKQGGSESVQQRYMETRVEFQRFAINPELMMGIKTVNDWLLELGEANLAETVLRPRPRKTSGLRSRSNATQRIPAALSEALDQAIQEDRSTDLLKYLEELRTLGNASPDDLLFDTTCSALLGMTFSAKAQECLEVLLSHVSSLVELDDIDQRTHIHKWIISLGRMTKVRDSDTTSSSGCLLQASKLQQNALPNFDDMFYLKPAAAPKIVIASSGPSGTEIPIDKDTFRDEVAFLKYVLNLFTTEQQLALITTDVYGKSPLHYAAQYGLSPICDVITTTLKSWGLFYNNTIAGNDNTSVFLHDLDGLSPLHLSVKAGHSLTTESLLRASALLDQAPDETSILSRISRYCLKVSSELLSIAVKSNFVTIVELLISAGVNLNYQDSQGECALHVAARFGHLKSAKALLDARGRQTIDLELCERNFGWTALHIACIDGHSDVAKLLLDNGTDSTHLDNSGWTALEHAALRGHVDIAEMISTHQTADMKIATMCADDTSSIGCSKSKTPNGKDSVRPSGVVQPVKSFGHHYLKNETMILVSLGTMDTRKKVEAVNLEQIPVNNLHSTELDTALSVVISVQGASGDPSIVDLPIEDNIFTDPVTFMTPDAANVKLLFDIVPTYAGSSDKIIGRGVAMLSSLRPSLGSKRISLQGDATVPIIAAQTMDVIGSVNFNYIIITPFTHANMAISENLTYWKSVESTMVIGHRGLGMNSIDRSSLQLGENTLESFIAAANLGASYVEFDVQLTKDHVPVIYHDFLVSETGIDAPMHTLTLEQFLHMSESHRPEVVSHHSRTPTATTATTIPSDQQSSPSTTSTNPSRSNSTVRKPRSASLGSSATDARDISLSRLRMKHTRDFKEKGFKGNSRGSFIQSPFTTLEEMLRTLPTSIGFNIEMKYPMLFESEEHEMDTYAVEINSFVDTILAKVYDYMIPSTAAGQTEPASPHRNIIFSSFNPDICLLLSFKQPSIPILFLTDAGMSPVGDIRASSLQEAIRFASRWNLLGIVAAAKPFILAPRLVRVVKESGLVCVSYGKENNVAGNVKRQVRQGVDAVIVDSVLAIRKGLTEDALD